MPDPLEAWQESRRCPAQREEKADGGGSGSTGPAAGRRVRALSYNPELERAELICVLAESMADLADTWPAMAELMFW